MTARDLAGKIAIGAGLAAGAALTYVLLERPDTFDKARTSMMSAADRLRSEEAKAKAEEAEEATRGWASRLREAAEDLAERYELRERLLSAAKEKAEDVLSSASETASTASRKITGPSTSEVFEGMAKAAGTTGGGIVDYAKLQMEKGTSAIGSRAEDIRSSMNKTVEDIEYSLGEAAEVTKDAASSLVRTALLGGLLVGMLVYVYAPEREQQIALWQRLKGYSAAACSAFQDLRSSVRQEPRV